MASIVRTKRNYTGSLKLDDGSWIESRVRIRRYLDWKFGQLFRSSEPEFLGDLEGLISPVLNDEDNLEFAKVPTPREIKSIVWAMH